MSNDIVGQLVNMCGQPVNMSLITDGQPVNMCGRPVIMSQITDGLNR